MKKEEIPLAFSEVRFFVDCGAIATALREHNGYPCMVEDITGKPEGLDERIAKWTARYDDEIEDVLDGVGPCIVASPEVREKYNEDGLALVKEVRKLLPSESRLFYIPVTEILSGGDAVEVFLE